MAVWFSLDPRCSGQTLLKQGATLVTRAESVGGIKVCCKEDLMQHIALRQNQHQGKGKQKGTIKSLSTDPIDRDIILEELSMDLMSLMQRV